MASSNTVANVTLTKCRQKLTLAFFKFNQNDTWHYRFQNMPFILIMTQNAAYLWPECIAVRALITYFNEFLLGDFRKVAICIQW